MVLLGVSASIPYLYTYIYTLYIYLYTTYIHIQLEYVFKVHIFTFTVSLYANVFLGKYMQWLNHYRKDR